MKHPIIGLALLAALAPTPARADDRKVFSGRAALGETWVYPMKFEQALAPLAPLSGKAVREGLCPGLVADKDDVIHNYDFEARFKQRGVENRRWEVTELKLANPSSCAALDEQVATRMKAAIPEFAEPRVDADKNGWTKIPRIQLKMTE
jgi:hypothetical protein